MTILDILSKGGVMMIPIILASIIAVYIIIMRWLALRKLQSDSRTFILQVRNMLLRNQVDDALMLCKNTNSPFSRMTRAGIENASRPRMEIKDAIESTAKAEIYHLEKHLGTLATIAGIAPMLGFLGTVTGMIRAFMEIQERGGNVDATVLAGGIWEALVTTAAGLAVGILALIFYNWVQGKVEQMVAEMEQSSIELLDTLHNETGVSTHELAAK